TGKAAPRSWTASPLPPVRADGPTAHGPVGIVRADLEDLPADPAAVDDLDGACSTAPGPERPITVFRELSRELIQLRRGWRRLPARTIAPNRRRMDDRNRRGLPGLVEVSARLGKERGVELRMLAAGAARALPAVVAGLQGVQPHRVALTRAESATAELEHLEQVGVTFVGWRHSYQRAHAVFSSAARTRESNSRNLSSSSHARQYAVGPTPALPSRRCGRSTISSATGGAGSEIWNMRLPPSKTSHQRSPVLKPP